MSRIVRCSLIQATNAAPPTATLQETKHAMVSKHVDYIRQAAEQGAQIVCLQEIFYGPYFCAEQQTRWYDFTEPVPGGETIQLLQKLARELHVVLIVPVYEVEQEGVYYNTAAVIHNDGSYLGKYRKTHIPHVAPGFWEKFYFKPGNLGYPVFDLGFAKIGVYICYDRHFPEGARALGLNGAEIVFNPSATVAGPERISLEARAAGARRRQRLLHRRHQSRRRRGALEHRRILRPELLLRSARAHLRASFARQRRSVNRRPRPRHDRRGPKNLAVLPRPPA